jgi:hypothetical protein
MKKNKTHATFILDRSGSMGIIWGDVTGGYESFIKEQKEKDGECSFSLHVFDDKFETIENFVDIQKASPTLKVSPRGMTALYDAIGKAINETGEKLRDLPEIERPEKVIVFIQTDGQENSSREFTSARVKEMIKHQNEKYNWEFIFLGADDACLEQAKSIGIGADYFASYHSGSGMTSGISRKLCDVRSASLEDFKYAAFLTDDDRATLES